MIRWTHDLLELGKAGDFLDSHGDLGAIRVVDWREDLCLCLCRISSRMVYIGFAQPVTISNRT